MRRPGAVPEALSPQVVCVYARFSNDQLQRDASIEDQVRTCTEAAAANGWLVEPSLIFRDAGISGAQMSTRDGIQTLLHRIESEKTKSFHGVIFDDSSRLGRNVSEVLSFCKLCEFHQVFLYFVNQELDSRDPNFYQLIMQFASGDEQFLKKLKQAVTRGQKGRIAEGMIHGGRYYGYNTVAIADPTKRSTASKIAIKGVKLVIDDVEASVVRAIFNWAEEGRSCRQIATACTDANFPRPCTARGTAGIWTRDNVWGILTNRLYCGFLTYGKTTTWKHPVSGKVQMRPVPQSGWTIKHFPDLAIVTTEQWDRVRSVIDSRKSVGLVRMAGAAKRDKSAPISLLSGLLFCDQCGNPFVVAGKPRRDGRSLMCKSFRYERKKCSCSLGVDEALLETRLVEYLITRILAHRPLDSAVECFHEALNAQSASAEESRRKAQAGSATLLREQNRLGKERENIIASLRELGPIESLKSEFARIEGRLKQVEDQLPRNTKPEVRRVPLEEARAFIHTQADRLSELLLADRNSVRQALLRHVGPLKLRLDAEHFPPTFQVKGDLHVSSRQLVIPSEAATDFRQYYEEFTMTIDLDVPAWVKPLGPAITHAYDAAVADLIAQGAPTYISIARSLGMVLMGEVDHRVDEGWMGILAHQSVLRGWPCAAGEVKIDNSGELLWCTLAVPQKTEAGVIPAGTGVSLYPGEPSDALLHLPNVGMQAQPGNFWIAPNEWFVLYSDGELLCVPGPVTLRGITLGSQDSSVVLRYGDEDLTRWYGYSDTQPRILARPPGQVTGWRGDLASALTCEGGHTIDKGRRVTVPISGDVVTTTHWDSSRPRAKPVLDSFHCGLGPAT